MEGVCAADLHLAGNLPRLVGIDSPLHPLVGRDAHDDRDPGTDRLAHTDQHVQGKSTPSMDVPAERVVAGVAGWGEELVQQVAVPHVQLDTVGAGVGGSTCGPSEGVDQGGHLGGVECPGPLPHGGAGDRGRRDGIAAQGRVQGLPAGVGQLDHQLSALTVNALGGHVQPVGVAVPIDPDLVRGHEAVPADREATGGDPAEPGARPACQELDVAIADGVPLAEGHVHRRHHHPGGGAKRAHVDRRQQPVQHPPTSSTAAAAAPSGLAQVTASRSPG